MCFELCSELPEEDSMRSSVALALNVPCFRCRWISEIQNNFSGHSVKEKGRVESETILRLQAIDMEKECDVLM